MKRLPIAVTISMIAVIAGATSALAENRASQILTPELAKKVLGKDVAPAPANSGADVVKEKTWVSRASYTVKGGTAPSVGIVIRHADNATQAKQIFEASKSSFNGDAVAGLGDAAFRTKTPGQLNVLKGVNWLIVSCGALGKPDAAGQEKAAKEILPKLQ